MDLSKQYDDFADKFSKLSLGDEGALDPSLDNSTSKKFFYEMLDFIKPGLKILDLACGDGEDILYYQKLGVSAYGQDSSKEMLEIAKTKVSNAEFRLSDFSKIDFEDGFFDVVLSKYAIQTAEDILPIYKEVYRVLKSGGTMMVLVTHPFRQFMERKNLSEDYFLQRIVDSNVFKEQITFKEPTHTMNEYLNKDFLSKFDIVDFKEVWDPAAEQVGGGKYPGFFILKAIKR